MWYGFSAEAWHEWCVANGLDPSDMDATMAKIQEGPKFECLKCPKPLDPNEVYIQLDPVAPIIAPKFLHRDCFLAHVEEHGEEENDVVMCYIYRKRV